MTTPANSGSRTALDPAPGTRQQVAQSFVLKTLRLFTGPDKNTAEFQKQNSALQPGKPVNLRVRAILPALFGALLLLLCSAVGFGQAATGFPPFGSFGGSSFDTVNNANLNVHFAIPIVRKAGRGLPFDYRLSYDSSV